MKAHVFSIGALIAFVGCQPVNNSVSVSCDISASLGASSVAFCIELSCEQCKLTTDDPCAPFVESLESQGAEATKIQGVSCSGAPLSTSLITNDDGVQITVECFGNNEFCMGLELR